MFTRTAPDATEIVTTEIREQRKHLASGSSYISEYYTQNHVVGRFTAVADAVVEVQLRIKHDTQFRYGKPETRTVQLAAVAKCNGHGCVDPEHEEPFTAPFLLDTDADETAKAAPALVAAAREWAQKHAETCRAMPYTG